MTGNLKDLDTGSEDDEEMEEIEDNKEINSNNTAPGLVLIDKPFFNC